VLGLSVRGRSLPIALPLLRVLRTVKGVSGLVSIALAGLLDGLDRGRLARGASLTSILALFLPLDLRPW